MIAYENMINFFNVNTSPYKTNNKTDRIFFIVYIMTCCIVEKNCIYVYGILHYCNMCFVAFIYSSVPRIKFDKRTSGRSVRPAVDRGSCRHCVSNVGVTVFVK